MAMVEPDYFVFDRPSVYFVADGSFHSNHSGEVANLSINVTWANFAIH